MRKMDVKWTLDFFEPYVTPSHQRGMNNLKKNSLYAELHSTLWDFNNGRNSVILKLSNWVELVLQSSQYKWKNPTKMDL